MNRSLFFIKKAFFSYTARKEDRVLYIEELDIPKGEVVFLLGASGSGKSTLLEALGLMNDTIREGEVRFAPESTVDPILLEELWEVKNEDALSRIRREYLSFIFQETNLMENFTAYENICLSQMIKKAIPFEEVLPDAKALMEKVHLPENEVSLSTLAVNLSGGQRQRVAFVRSLNSRFSVLFGDEPTGNLDEKNANELMQLIREQLKGERSAIIVSHDVDLALEHADRIVLLTKRDGVGEVLAENIYHSSEWKGLDLAARTAFRNKLAGLYQLDVESIPSRLSGGGQSSNPQPGLVKSFRSLFLRKEGKELLGNGLQNLWILAVMMFLTLLAIGFANGSLVYLSEKMDDPFVNWLTISVPYARAEGIPETLTKLKSKEERERFGYNENVTTFSEYYMRFEDKQSGEFIGAKGRSFDLSRPGQNNLLRAILSEKNVVRGDTVPFTDPLDFRVIVTERFFKQMNLPETSNFIYLGQVVGKGAEEGGELFSSIPIPILSVVREMPGKNSLAFTSCFLNAVSDTEKEAFDLSNKNTLWVFVKGGRAEVERVEKALESFLNRNPELEKQYDPNYTLLPRTDFLDEGNALLFAFGEVVSPEEVTAFYDAFEASPQFEAISGLVFRFYDYSSDAPKDCSRMERTADQISLYFNKLQKVREFSEHFFKAYNQADDQQFLEVDMEKVIEKENFYFLSRVTGIVSYLLVLFGLVAISLFLSNVLKMHFSRVQMNLGTFKAFGLQNATVVQIYFIIILRYVLLALLISLTLTLAIGYLVNYLLMVNISVEQGISYFQPFHLHTFITIVVLCITAVGVSFFITKRLISKTPGDLIYNR